jgi:hypothetical protein
MSKKSNTGVIIAIVVLVLVAAALRLFGGPLYETLLRLHGPAGGGGH